MRQVGFIARTRTQLTFQNEAKNRALQSHFHQKGGRCICTFSKLNTTLEKRHISWTKFPTHLDNFNALLPTDQRKSLSSWSASKSIENDAIMNSHSHDLEESHIHQYTLTENVESFFIDVHPSLTKARDLIENCVSSFNQNQSQSAIDDAQKIFNYTLRVPVSDSNPDERTKIFSSMLNNILSMLVKKGDIQSTIQCFHQNLKYCDTIAFHTVLNMCASFQLSQEAEDILLLMTKNASQSNTQDEPVISSTKSFNLVLKAQRLPQRAHSILERMITLWKDDGHENTKPDIISFNTVMNAYAQWSDTAQNKVKPSMQRSQNVKELLHMMQDKMAGTTVQPNLTSYNILLHAYSMDHHPQSAEEWLHKMIDSESLPDPDAISYATCINAYVKNGQLQEAVGVLNDSKLNNYGIYPATFGYNSLLRGLCNEKKPERAEKILNQMKAQPDVDTYNIMIDAYSIQRKPTSAHRILDQLEQKSKSNDKSGSSISLQPNSFSYNSVISAYSSVGQAERATSILQRMEKQYQSWNYDVLPDTITYNIVLSAYLKGRTPIPHKSAFNAQSLLLRMEKLYEEGKKEVQPDVITYTTVMKCWILSKHRDAHKNINLILTKLEKLEEEEPEESEESDKNSKRIKLDAAVYNVYLNAFSDPKILWKSQAKESATNLAFNTLHRMLSRSKKYDNPDVKPNIITYNTILNILVKHGQVRRAYKLLIEMEKGSFESGDSLKVYPNILSYNTVLDGLAKTGKGKEAKALLEKMALTTLKKERENIIRPNLHSFNTVLLAFAKQGDSTNAEELLQVIKDLYLNSSKGEHGNTQPLFKPDQRTYAAVMNAHAKSGNSNSLQKVEELLAEMTRDWNLDPDSTCYNILIHTIARSEEEGKARKAFDVFCEMKEPNSTSLNSVLNACAFTTKENAKAEALEITLQILEEILKKASDRGQRKNLSDESNAISTFSRFKARPDEITFSTMMKACHNLWNGRNEDKLKLVERIFVEACKSGHVGKMVLKELRYCLHENQIVPFLDRVSNHNDVRMQIRRKNGKSSEREKKVMSLNDLPRSWSRNTRSN